MRPQHQFKADLQRNRVAFIGTINDLARIQLAVAQINQ